MMTQSSGALNRSVLVVEDEQDIARLLQLHLEECCDRVTCVNNGQDGLREAMARPWGLIILDLRLPGISGLEICRQLRSAQRYVPILMLTAKSTELDRVLGLEIGADDYVTKPFSIQELMARVKAIFRRCEAMGKLQSTVVADKVLELECLESAFAAMQERIRNQVQQIRQSDEMRRELIANISHDLRTPLTNMLGYIETLLLKGESLAPAQQQQYLEITRNHGQKQGRLIADLFELAKLDGGAVQAQRETFSIAELIHDVVQDFALQAERNKVTVQVQGDLDQAWVCADIRLMERVLENLLDNALKSTGLGLAIVKRILDLHRSTIDVTSHLSQGTTFEFVLSR